MIFVEEGQSPLILCLPHSGSDVPQAVANRLNATGRLQADLAWRLERVLDFNAIPELTVIRSSISRYVIDLDKDPSTLQSAGNDPELALCPAATLDGKQIYQDGEEPGPTEIEQRLLLFYVPFHNALRNQINRLMKLHRDVVVLNCQSMRSQIKGVTGKGLPLVNIGSADGASCDESLRNLLVGSFSGLEGFTVSVDEYTKGGYITRTYGRPDQGLHCLTVLLAQRAYLRHESPPFEPDKSRVTRLQAVLADGFSRVVDWTGMQTHDRPVRPATSASGGEVSGSVETEEPAEVAETAGEVEQDPERSASEPVAGESETSPDAPGPLTAQSKNERATSTEKQTTPLLVAE